MSINNSQNVTLMDNINHTMIPSTTPYVSRPTRQHFDTFNNLRFYLLAFVIPLGILFNLLSCAVFLRSRMRKSATVFYFFALACADNFVLLGELFLWLNSITTNGHITGLKFMQENDGMCKFVNFLRYFGRLFSSWLVVTICIERFITVVYPFKSTWSSTPTKAKVVIFVLILICIILSCPAFFALGSVPTKRGLLCKILSSYISDYGWWVLFVMIFGELVIPSIIVIIFTSLIITKLIKARRQRLLTKEGQEKGPRSHKDRQPTIALLAVSIAFVTLRTPYVFMYPLYMNRRNVFPNLTHWQVLELKAAYEISFTLAVINYAINFLLYIVTGKRFRGEFKRFLLCRKSTLGPTWSRSYSMTSQSTSLRRGSNTDILRIRNEALEDRKGSLSGSATPPAKYTPLRQDSQL